MFRLKLMREVPLIRLREDPLKQLDCDLAGFRECVDAHVWHALNSELIDEELLCCCERARLAIKDFTNRGRDSKVSDCFPVAFDALCDLQWCLGKILRAGYEGIFVADIDMDLAQISKSSTVYLPDIKISRTLPKRALSCWEYLRNAIKDCTNQVEQDGEVSCRFSFASDTLQDSKLCLQQGQIQARMSGSSLGRFPFYVALDLAHDVAGVICMLRDLGRPQDIFIRHVDVLFRRNPETDRTRRQAETRNDADKIETINYQGIMSLTFFQEEADEIKTEANIPVRTRTRTLDYSGRFAVRNRYNRRLSSWLTDIGGSLCDLGLPQTSLHKQGPSVSHSWDARNGSSSVHLPPGLNVDSFGEIQYIRTLGEGSQGIVYEALWRGQKVAVKEVHCETRSQGLEVLESVMRSAGHDSVSRSNLYGELDVLKTLRHPNIVELTGYTRKPRVAGNYGLVMELMEGSLAGLISKSEDFSELVKVDTLLQVARGMRFLHRVGIMHRDLKPANILIKQLTYLQSDARHLRYVVAKLADFGLSKGLSKPVDEAASHTYKQGTSFYMAPEVRTSSDDASQSQYAMSADVFSFGTTCFNVLTGEATPFVQDGQPLKSDEFYRMIGKEDLDPFVIHHGRSKVARLVRQCWRLDPKKRPTFVKICRILEVKKRRILLRASTPTSRLSRQ